MTTRKARARAKAKVRARGAATATAKTNTGVLHFAQDDGEKLATVRSKGRKQIPKGNDRKKGKSKSRSSAFGEG
jgi:hypothetical protein